LAIFLCRLFNLSLERATVPSNFKSGYVTPLLKNADVDAADVKSYLPITNLSLISKLLERLVAQQLVKYLTEKGVLPDRQSAYEYRAHYSTDTAVLQVVADILLALDCGNLAVLVLLDLSAAFDTVDHSTLLQRLRVSYGLDDTILQWFASYLSGRTQYIRSLATTSSPSEVGCEVPQGSVFGPILFLLYVADLLQLVKRHQLSPHACADDTQIYGFCRPTDTDDLSNRVSVCVDEVSQWMRANRPQLNPAKTQVLWCSSARRQYQIPNTPVHIGSRSAQPVSIVCDLGVIIDANVTMKAHVTVTLRSCFAALRQIRSVCHALPQHAVTTKSSAPLSSARSTTVPQR